MGRMRAHVAVVHPGVPTMVDIVAAGVPLRGEWVGPPPNAGEFVELQDQELLTVRMADGIPRTRSGCGIRRSWSTW